MPPLVVLNVAEKPSVARSLAEVFAQSPGAVNRPMQRGEAAQVFCSENVRFPDLTRQGSGRPLPPNAGPDVPHTMITTSVRGHLAAQDFDSSQYGWSSCPPVALFDAPIETKYNPDMEPLMRMLKTKARTVGALILWLDCDREGEAISDEVRAVCLEGNPRLANGRVYRAKFSTVLPQEIRRALRSLGRVNEHWVQAVQARSEHDLRVGAAFTRFQTLRLQKKFEGFSDRGVVSYGPCQFPTLGFVVERWARIETFVPEDFWLIDMSIRLNADGTVANSNGNQDQQQRRDDVHIPSRGGGAGGGGGGGGRPIHFTWKRGRLYDRLATLALYESCLDAGEAVVTDLSGRPKNKWRPVPLATVELQKRASRYLRIGSESVMTAAEALYNDGLISYPRTETERFRPEFEHMPLIQSFQGVGGDIGDYATRLLTHNNFQNPRAGQNDDNAHPPITPARAVDPSTIGDPQQRGIYTLVVKHYLACCSRDAMGKETTLTIKMASEEFTAKGLMILERNWLEIYSPWERWSTGQGELPRLQVGSRVAPSSLLMKEGRTQAPPPISEVELITLMDRNGIGTDATIAQHITTIQDREYAEKDHAQKFLPTKLGIALVEGYNSMGYQLNRPDLRREMEAECNQVAAGQKTKDQILGPCLTKMRECFSKASAEAHKLDAAVARNFTRLGAADNTAVTLQRNFSLCGDCGGLMDLKQRGGGGRQQQRQRNNQNVRAPPKILYCSTCAGGLELPRGNPQPMTDPQNRDQPFRCPICQYQVIRLGPGDGYTGNGYQTCPRCYADAPAEFGGAATAGAGSFRCFNCTHSTCSLSGGTAGGDIEVFPCPFCQRSGNGDGKVRLKKTPRTYLLSCSNNSGAAASCQYSIWLPREASTVTVEEAEHMTCRRCSDATKTVRRLKFDWKPGSVPPHYDRSYVGCVLCDDTLRQDMNIRLPQSNQVSTNSRNRTRAAAGTTNRSTAGGRGGSGRGDSVGGRTTGTAGGRGSFGGGGNSHGNGNGNGNNSYTYGNGNGYPNNNNAGGNGFGGGGFANDWWNNPSGPGGNASGSGGRGRAGGRGRGRGGGRSSTSGRGGGGRGGGGGGFTCYRCGQSGHFANACPNN